MAVFRVLVESATYDEIKRGETATELTRVQVEARDEEDAMCLAAQLVASRGRMPTRTTPEY